MKQKTIVLNGKNLTINDICRFVYNTHYKIAVNRTALKKVRRAHEFVMQKMNSEVNYGINTGFGPMASHIIGQHQLAELQRNLIMSHAVGLGEPLPESYVLSSMIVRLNTLIKGFSGVSEELVKHLLRLINNRIIPVIPEHGAVGTSGDLTQLAHIAFAVMGEGEVFYNGKRQSSANALKKIHMKPYKLKPKEGLGLINGTSVMAGISALLFHDARKVFSFALMDGALALEVVHGFSDGISPQLHKLRPHKGQVEVARSLRQLLKGTHMIKNRNSLYKRLKLNADVHEVSDDVQEVYSIRCIPQILGPIYDVLKNTKRNIEIEINSVTDNPIVDWEHEAFLHGGNFHGEYIATTIDQLKIGITKLTMLSERRTNYFLNHKINKRFPPFLNLSKPGLTLGLQGVQFIATSTTAQSQTLSYPHHIHSISTNEDNQDVVSMGTDAALFAAKVISNAYVVIAVELVTLLQAVDFLQIRSKISPSTRELYMQTRKIFPTLKKDTPALSKNLSNLHHALQHSEFFENLISKTLNV